MWVIFSLIYVYLLVLMVRNMSTTAYLNAWKYILYRTQDKISQLLIEDKVKDAETEWYAYRLYKQAVWKI